MSKAERVAEAQQLWAIEVITTTKSEPCWEGWKSGRDGNQGGRSGGRGGAQVALLDQSCQGSGLSVVSSHRIWSLRKVRGRRTMVILQQVSACISSPLSELGRVMLGGTGLPPSMLSSLLAVESVPGSSS